MFRKQRISKASLFPLSLRCHAINFGSLVMIFGSHLTATFLQPDHLGSERALARPTSHLPQDPTVFSMWIQVIFVNSLILSTLVHIPGMNGGPLQSPSPRAALLTAAEARQCHRKHSASLLLLKQTNKLVYHNEH